MTSVGFQAIRMPLNADVKVVSCLLVRDDFPHALIADDVASRRPTARRMWEPYIERQAATNDVADTGVPPGRRREQPDDCQAEAAALDVAGAAGTAVVRLPDRATIGLGDAGAAVLHGNLDHGAAGSDTAGFDVRIEHLMRMSPRAEYLTALAT